MKYEFSPESGKVKVHPSKKDYKERHTHQLHELMESRKAEMHEHFKKNPVKPFKKKGVVGKILDKFK